MSLLDLLVRYPAYPARKVRRLARQIDLLKSIETTCTEPSLVKGMIEDLVKFNIEQAKQETRFSENPPPRTDIERVLVTPVARARKALGQLECWLRVNSDATMKADELSKLLEKCTGLITGSSFYADRQVSRDDQ